MSAVPQRWESWARWPHPEVRLGNELNESTDDHATKDEAEGIARRLKVEGFGGERTIFPLETGVRPYVKK